MERGVGYPLRGDIRGVWIAIIARKGSDFFLSFEYGEITGTHPLAPLFCRPGNRDGQPAERTRQIGA